MEVVTADNFFALMLDTNELNLLRKLIKIDKLKTNPTWKMTPRWFANFFFCSIRRVIWCGNFRFFFLQTWIQNRDGFEFSMFTHPFENEFENLSLQMMMMQRMAQNFNNFPMQHETLPLHVWLSLTKLNSKTQNHCPLHSSLYVCNDGERNHDDAIKIVSYVLWWQRFKQFKL